MLTYNARGEDRSNHNPVKNWTGLSFGFVKATEGETFTDDTFAQNWVNLHGKPRGAYHFLRPELDPVKQARYFVSAVKAQGLEPGDMLVVDSEMLTNYAGQPLTGEQVDICTRDFIDEVRSLVGSEHPILVYCNHNVGQHLVRSAVACPLLWFAYPSATAPDAALIAPWKAWKFWQYGTKDNTDQDVYDGSPADLSVFIKGYLPVLRRVVHWRVMRPVSLAAVAKRRKMTPEEMIRLGERHTKYGRAMRRYIERGNWNARLPLLTELFAYAPVA